jgi:hypothetical protein
MDLDRSAATLEITGCERIGNFLLVGTFRCGISWFALADLLLNQLQTTTELYSNIFIGM